jgi:hypothetical protein
MDARPVMMDNIAAIFDALRAGAGSRVPGEGWGPWKGRTERFDADAAPSLENLHIAYYYRLVTVDSEDEDDPKAASVIPSRNHFTRRCKTRRMVNAH